MQGRENEIAWEQGVRQNGPEVVNKSKEDTSTT